VFEVENVLVDAFDLSRWMIRPSKTRGKNLLLRRIPDGRPSKFLPQIRNEGRVGVPAFFSLRSPEPTWARPVCPAVFYRGTPIMFTPLECRLRAAECQNMVEHSPNPGVRAILVDMVRTWTRLAMEAERTIKESRPPLKLIDPNPHAPPASQQTPRDF